MLVSLEWLKEYVDFDISPAQLAEKLTMAGIEVEELISSSTTGLDKVVVGKIVNYKLHPNANKLSICMVDIGASDLLPIICGAPNAREGLFSPLAIVGAELPNGFKIQAAKIRGETSFGMLCSEKELGLGNDADGIIELPPDFKPGTPIIEALGLDNVIMKLELTPNRSDCLSIIGIAREVSAITGNPLRKPEIHFPEGNKRASDMTSVTIDAPDLCPRYAARLVLGVRVAPSPYWMRRRLESVGLRSINNVVDVTNYVLMEFGHPLHAFDFDNLAGKRIIVRRARPGESITTLDAAQRQLNDDMLVIADEGKAVAVAGVMGGAGSDMDDATINVLIESAYFDPVSISRTSKALGMHTEASHRFERGTDIEGLISALNRAAQLTQNLAGGEICSGIVDTYPSPRERIEVKLRPERVNWVLGTELKPDEMQRFLTSIEFQVNNTGDEMSITVPTFRPDVMREIDLIEEIARLYGYDNIPVTMPASEVPPESEIEHITFSKIVFREKIRNTLTACGLTEVMNYTFHGPDAFDLLQMEEDSEYRRVLKIKNPISETQSVIRTTLMPGLLANVGHNLSRQITDMQIFEIGRVFHPKDGNKQPDEREFVSGVISGTANSQLWNQPTRPVDFFDIKGCVESILDELSIHDYHFRPLSCPPFQPSRSAELVIGDTSAGMLGEIRRDVLDKYDINQDVYAFELDFNKLITHVSSDRFEQLPVFPSVLRDIALVLDFNIPSSQIESAIRSAGGDMVKSVTLFDVYKGKQIPENKKSLAYSIEYYSPDRTLTDDEVDAVNNKILSALANDFGAELRK